MIHGISHITLIVRDIEKTAGLFIKIFGVREVYSSGENIHSRSREKFFMINDTWFALMEGDSSKEKTYNHVAFKISDKDFERYSEEIAGMGLEIIGDRKRITGEGRDLFLRLRQSPFRTSYRFAR